MLQHATAITIAGFVLFLLGLISLLLNYVGVDIFFLTWLYALGAGTSFFIRLMMVIVGLILIYVGGTDWDQEEI